MSTIVLTWNSYEVTRDCLLSLRKVDYPNFEVLLVDNGSRDSSPQQLHREFPEVRLIQNSENLGFPGGNNVGICAAMEQGADYLLLLNNDTVVSPDFLSQLVAVAETDPRIGILSPKIYFFAPSDRLWCAGGCYKPQLGTAIMRGTHQRDTGQYDRVEEVSFATGCAFLIKSEVVRRIGLLDEVFFLGYEDLDWSVRACNAGFKVYYAPSAVIWHKESYLTKKYLGKPVKDFYATRNRVLFARKHLRMYHLPLFLLSLAQWMAYRTAGYLLRAEFARVNALYKGIWSGIVTPLNDQNAVGKQANSRTDFTQAQR